MRATDVLLHPVRLRIALTFLGDRVMTARQVGAELPGVPTATLYRQLGALAEGGVLEVVNERRVRGAVERSYRMTTGAASAGQDDAGRMTPDEHRRAFVAFALSLLADFGRYLDAPGSDPGRDAFGYRAVALHLSDAETRELAEELRAVVAPRLAHEPAAGRTRRVLATVLLPAEGEHGRTAYPRTAR